jgi:hypothetical protein
MGRRSLKNICLSYLLALDPLPTPHLDLAMKQYATKANMTDVMAALGGLAHCQVDERLDALADFYQQWQEEPLVVDKWLTLQASNGIARARCLNTIGREGEVTVVVVPKLDDRRLDLNMKLVPSTELLRRVKHFLDERRLLTTIVHVVRPRYTEVSISVEIIRTTSGRSEALRRAVEERLRSFLHPLIGGRDGKGWSFGRNVLKLDLYHVIEDIEGVDVVHRIRLIDEDRRTEVDQVKLRPDELVHLVDVDVIEKPREQFA